MQTWGDGYQELFSMRSNGRFGIGTSSPSQALDVNGNIASNHIIARNNT